MVKSRVRALALGLWLGAVSIFPGCGSSRSPLSTEGDAQMPASIAQGLSSCAEERRTHLGMGQHAIRFELELNEDGQVDEVALKDSTLDDQGLEACMAGVLRSLSMDELPLRVSEHELSEPVEPESKALMGQEQVLLCLASPPCLMAMGLVIGASFLVVQIYVSQASRLRPWTLVRPAVPTLTPLPPAIRKECFERYVQCTGMSPLPPCGVCILKCNTQREWPEDLCPNEKK